MVRNKLTHRNYQERGTNQNKQSLSDVTWTQDVPTSWRLCMALNTLRPFWREDLAKVQKWWIRSGATSVQRKDQGSSAWKQQNWQEMWQQLHVSDTETAFHCLFPYNTQMPPSKTRGNRYKLNYVSMTKYFGWQRMTSVSEQIPTSKWKRGY